MFESMYISLLPLQKTAVRLSRNLDTMSHFLNFKCLNRNLQAFPFYYGGLYHKNQSFFCGGRQQGTVMRSTYPTDYGPYSVPLSPG
jgi:hypothetical protein